MPGLSELHDTYSDEMRRGGANYQERFKKIKTLRIERDKPERISSEKVNKLAHAVADTLATLENVDFLEDRNTIRQEARRILEEMLAGSQDRSGRPAED